MKYYKVILPFLAGLVLLALCACGGGQSAADNRLASGYDEYGLNEVAGIFDGSYFDNYSGRAPYYYDAWAPYDGDDAAYLADNPGADTHWAWPYRTTRVLMKWNHDWPNAGGWITNHMWDSYEDGGQTYNWDYFTKIVWVGPAPAPPAEDPYAATRIWGDYATIQEVYNDSGSGDHGNIPIPGPNGFGNY